MDKNKVVLRAKKIVLQFLCWICSQATFTKIVVAALLYKAVGWIDQSYALAWADHENTLESLSTTAMTEILGVFGLYAAKALFEKLSEHNTWPDKVAPVITNDVPAPPEPPTEERDC